ncbi:MAG: hypothetical protein K6T86_18965 [Pirellulales bacterium]|nr:hypothetical protein [Pirellulales bacterium]
MTKLVATTLGLAVAVAIVWGPSFHEAGAKPPYKKEWDTMYMQEGSAMYKALEGKSNCNVCHQGKNRKNRNAYGKALAKYLEKGDEKKPEKIVDALKKAAEEHSDPNDANSATFGELIDKGELPVTLDEPN